MGQACQVDFYLLGSPSLDADQLACKLAMMAWERGHRVSIVTGDEARTERLDTLMWTCPEGRFLPHEAGAGSRAPVELLAEPPGEQGDVVINLTQNALPTPLPWNRLLEIVPHREEDRNASRDKFRHYRAGGLDPKAHEIN